MGILDILLGRKHPPMMDWISTRQREAGRTESSQQ